MAFVFKDIFNDWFRKKSTKKGTFTQSEQKLENAFNRLNNNVKRHILSYNNCGNTINVIMPIINITRETSDEVIIKAFELVSQIVAKETKKSKIIHLTVDKGTEQKDKHYAYQQIATCSLVDNGHGLWEGTADVALTEDQWMDSVRAVQQADGSFRVSFRVWGQSNGPILTFKLFPGASMSTFCARSDNDGKLNRFVWGHPIRARLE